MVPPIELQLAAISSGLPLAARLRDLVRFAILAPSQGNAQPWLFRVCGRTVELLADESRSDAGCDPDGRELTIGCGAALFHLRLAMRRAGLRERTELLPDPAEPALLARVVTEGAREPSADDRLLFEAIELRRTNREAYSDREVAADLLDCAREAAVREGAWLASAGPERREAIAALVARGEHAQHPHRWFRRHVMRGAPVLVVLGTEGDERADWLDAGQALGRVLLLLAANGVDASFVNQPIEVEGLREELAALVGGGVPQVLLRVGYGPHVPRTDRRPVADVLA